ncbi:hypothetical protein NDU88_007838, partial [Pleurodeles waltl]
LLTADAIPRLLLPSAPTHLRSLSPPPRQSAAQPQVVGCISPALRASLCTRRSDRTIVQPLWMSVRGGRSAPVVPLLPISARH